MITQSEMSMSSTMEPIQSFISMSAEGPQEVVLFVKPDVGYGLHFHGFEDELITLVGFDTAFDAWSFCFSHLSIDVSLVRGRKTVGRWWTFKPRELVMKQGKLL